MTASPTAVPSAPTSSTDGGNALAALFAAAAASSMQRQLSTPSTTSLPISSNRHPKAAKTTTTTTTPTTATPTTTRTKLSDNDANNGAAKLLASLLNKPAKAASNSSSSSSSSSTGFVEPTVKHKLAQLIAPKPVVKATSPEKSTIPEHALRNLESWHDEERLDDSCYKELVDSSNQNGWSADDMFKYNEKRHKIMSSYNEKTTAVNYTTPLPKQKSKTNVRMATQLAKEIEQRVLAEGRITPESSDDDDLFERERLRRTQLKQQKQLDQLWTLTRGNNIMHSTPNKDNGHKSSNNHHLSARKSNRSSSQYSNSSTTPATASLSSSPTLNDSNTIIKPVTSSSRNILRTCLS